MRRVLKWVAGGIAALVGVVLLAMLSLALLVDPNDYREQIATQVEKHTGRELLIEGDITLSFFPWLGLELGKMELGNAEGFGPEPFAAIEAAEARVKILPLLRASVEMDTVVLHGFNLSLARRADGVSNWDDLAGSAEAEDETPAAEAEAEESPQRQLEALAIGGIEIRDARVQWNDEMGGQRITLRDFNLVSGEISFDEPISLAIDGKVSASEPAVEAGFDLATRVALDLAQQRYRLDDLRFKLDADGEVIPGGRMQLALSGDLAADLAAATAQLRNLQLEAMGVQLNAEVDAANLLDAPEFSGKLFSGEFVPRELLQGLDIALPEMADPSAMTRAQFSSNFKAGLDHAALEQLQLQLDDSSLSGSASVRQFATPVIRYQLALDEIDVDRYLPPPSEAPAETPAETPAEGAGAEAGSEAADLPLELLRSLDIDGSFTVGKVKVMNLHSDSINTRLRAEQGQFRVNPLSANLYQGSYSGDLRFDVRSDTPKLGMNEKLTAVESGPLLKDFLGKDYVTGKANLAAKMSATGIEPMAIRKSLNGNGSFSFEDGQVNGINIGHLIRKGYALYKKQPEPAEETRQTDFTDLSGSFTVQNGLVSTSDLAARSPLFRVDGKGTAHLVSEKLDMRLDTTVLSDIKSAAGDSTEELKGVAIPITIKGSFSEPKFGVDVSSVLKAKLDAEVDKKKEEAKAELEKKKQEAEAEAQQRIDEEKKKLEDKAKDKLKDMLRF